MFDNETAIAEWRRQMMDARIQTAATLDELENHLRENIRGLVLAGKSESEAFQIAVYKLGSPFSMKTEFDKIEDKPNKPLRISAALWLGTVVLLAALFVCGRRFNPLMSAHIFTMTVGYFTAFLSGCFGIAYLFCRSFQTLSPYRQRTFSHAVRVFSLIAACFVIVGLLLGLFVSRQLFGEYWRNNLREIGALIAALWLIGLSVAQRIGQVKDRSAMILSVAGNLIVSLAWFGAGILSSHPSAGSCGGNSWIAGLCAFLGFHICVLILGLAPDSRIAEN